MSPCLWCLHGIVKAPNSLSRFSLRQWCQALAAKKDDFINDLINHQKLPLSTDFALIHPARPSLPELLPKADISHTHTHIDTHRETHTHTHTHTQIETHLLFFHCNTSSLVLSLRSPDSNLLPPWPAGRQQKCPKSKVTTIQDASRSGGITTTKGQLSPSLRRTGEDKRPVQQISSSFLLHPPHKSFILTTCWAHRGSLPGWIKASAFGSTEQTFRLVI